MQVEDIEPVAPVAQDYCQCEALIKGKPCGHRAPLSLFLYAHKSFEWPEEADAETIRIEA